MAWIKIWSTTSVALGTYSIFEAVIGGNLSLVGGGSKTLTEVLIL